MKTFSKKEFGTKRLLTLVWIIFSVPFVIWTLWAMGLNLTYNVGINRGMQQGQDIGRFNAYSEVVQAANNEKCAPFPIELKDTTTTLVNVACLQKATATESAEQR